MWRSVLSWIAWVGAAALALLLIAIATIGVMNVGIDTSWLPQFS